MSSTLSNYFSFYGSYFDVKSKTTCLALDPEGITKIFISKIHLILHFTFKSVAHSELIFCRRYEFYVKFHAHHGIQLVQQNVC